jgi:hypothetical protein
MRDMNQAIAILDAMHHWRLQVHNSEGRRRCYECTIWNGGRRVNGYGQTPVAAIMRAIDNLKQPRRRKRMKKLEWTPTLVCD